MSNPNVTIDRTKYIGGSDLPAILGYNVKYGKSPYEFALEKSGVKPSEFKGNQYTKYGQLMEPILRDYINAKYGCNYVEDTKIDNRNSHRGNTDGIDKNAQVPIIEIKTFGEKLNVDYYTPQCLFYMKIFDVLAVRLVGYQRPDDFYTGIDYDLENDDSYFNLDFDENRIEEHVIFFDDEKWKELNKTIKKFQKLVEKIKLGEITNEDDFNKEFYGTDLQKLVQEKSLLETKILDLKNYEKQLKEINEKLYETFEEKGIMSLDMGSVKLTKVEPTTYETISIDTTKLKEDHEDIYEEYKKIKTVNRKGYILTTVRDKEDDKNVVTS